MSKSELIRLSGWVFMAGSFAFITILGGSDSIAFPGSVISAILLAAGVLGLRSCYREQVGSFGRNILLMGVIGMVLWYLGIASLAVMNNSGILHVTQADSQRLWIVIFGGPAVVLVALTLFGLAVLRSKPMRRLNWLPAFAGIWYPVFYFFLAGYLFTHNGVYPGQYQIAFNIVHLIQFLALCAFGSILVIDASQEMATA